MIKSPVFGSKPVFRTIPSWLSWHRCLTLLSYMHTSFIFLFLVNDEWGLQREKWRNANFFVFLFWKDNFVKSFWRLGLTYFRDNLTLPILVNITATSYFMIFLINLRIIFDGYLSFEWIELNMYPRSIHLST